jgi:triacylglycerol lipase
MERNHLRHWVRDYETATRLQTRAVLFPKPPREYLGHSGEKLPVILLPGLLENWQFLKKVADSLSDAGHDIYTIPKLGLNKLNLESADHIIDFFISSHKIPDAIIVAHSKGGIEGGEILKHYPNIRMIAIATPFNGSTMADHVPFRSFKEMSLRNETIIRLGLDEGIKKRVLSIYPEFDNHIPNKDGSRLRGADGIQLDGVYGHHKILESPELIRTVLKKVNLWEKERK